MALQRWLKVQRWVSDRGFCLAGDALYWELPQSMAQRFSVELSLFQLDLDGCEWARMVKGYRQRKGKIDNI